MIRRTGSINSRGAPTPWHSSRLVFSLITALAAVAAVAAGTTAALTNQATARAAANKHRGPGVGTILFSLHANRARAQPLRNQKLRATRRIYVFIAASKRIAKVSFYFDDPKRTGTPWSITGHGPYDLNGGAPHRTARGFDLGALADTAHTITAAVAMKNGSTRVMNVHFKILTTSGHQYARETFGDEFNGTRVDTAHWNLFRGLGNASRGVRSPSAVTVDGKGNLVITASMANGQITSGGLQWNTGYTYGHYETRVRTEADPANNMSGVVLLWPASQNRIDGEEDFYETLGTRQPLNFFLHDRSANPAAQDYFRAPVDATQWHTVAFDWQPGSMTLYLDGIRSWTDTNPAAMTSKPHKLSIQFDPSSLLSLPGPVHMYVDYTRLYQ